MSDDKEASVGHVDLTLKEAMKKVLEHIGDLEYFGYEPSESDDPKVAAYIHQMKMAVEVITNAMMSEPAQVVAFPTKAVPKWNDGSKGNPLTKEKVKGFLTEMNELEGTWILFYDSASHGKRRYLAGAEPMVHDNGQMVGHKLKWSYEESEAKKMPQGAASYAQLISLGSGYKNVLMKDTTAPHLTNA